MRNVCLCPVCVGERSPLRIDSTLESSDPMPPKPDLGEGYTVTDISSEAYREVHLGSRVYRIDRPAWLIRRQGGYTHRVIDFNGKTHCYAAPEFGFSIVTWASEEGVSF